MPINFPPGTGKYLANSGVRVSLQQTWDKRVEGWDSHVTSAAAFGEVRDRLLRAARPAPGDACADLGTGTGFVTFEPVLAEAGIVSAAGPSTRG